MKLSAEAREALQLRVAIRIYAAMAEKTQVERLPKAATFAIDAAIAFTDVWAAELSEDDHG